MNTIFYTVKAIGDNIVITVDYPKELVRGNYDADRISNAITASVLTDAAANEQ